MKVLKSVVRLAPHRLNPHHIDVLRQVFEVVAAVRRREDVRALLQERAHAREYVLQRDAALALAGLSRTGAFDGRLRDALQSPRR